MSCDFLPPLAPLGNIGNMIVTEHEVCERNPCIYYHVLSVMPEVCTTLCLSVCMISFKKCRLMIDTAMHMHK